MDIESNNKDDGVLDGDEQYILNFYRRNQKKENQANLDELLSRRGNYSLLESDHSYIQWLFPIAEQGVNYSCPPISQNEIEIFRSDQQLKNELLKGYEMMLDFYGMALDINSKKVRRSENYSSRYEHLNNSHHNFLRISRILRCLTILDLNDYSLEFLRHLIWEVLITKKLSNAKHSCIEFWMNQSDCSFNWSTKDINELKTNLLDENHRLEDLDDYLETNAVFEEKSADKSSLMENTDHTVIDNLCEYSETSPKEEVIIDRIEMNENLFIEKERNNMDCIEVNRNNELEQVPIKNTSIDGSSGNCFNSSSGHISLVEANLKDSEKLSDAGIKFSNNYKTKVIKKEVLKYYIDEKTTHVHAQELKIKKRRDLTHLRNYIPPKSINKSIYSIFKQSFLK